MASRKLASHLMQAASTFMPASRATSRLDRIAARVCCALVSCSF